MWVIEVRGPVQVRTGSPGFGAPPNLEPDFGSSSAPTLNLGPDLGPVREGSGPDRGSALNRGNTTTSTQSKIERGKGRPQFP